MNTEMMLLQIAEVNVSNRWPSWIRWYIVRRSFMKMKKAIAKETD